MGIDIKSRDEKQHYVVESHIQQLRHILAYTKDTTGQIKIIFDRLRWFADLWSRARSLSTYAEIGGSVRDVFQQEDVEYAAWCCTEATRIAENLRFWLEGRTITIDWFALTNKKRWDISVLNH
jgi:hypothetical protein